MNVQRLELRQGQSLVMTPQLQLSLKVLQLSSMELAEYVEQELEKNPFLEKATTDTSDIPDNSDSVDNTDTSESSNISDANESEQSVDISDAAFSEISTSEKDEILDENYKNALAEQDSDRPQPEPSYEESSVLHIDSKGGSTNFSDNDSYYEQILSEDITLREHLLEQINLDIHDPVKRIIAIHLLDIMDDSGYISSDFTPIIKLLDCEESLIEEVLKNLQKLDPPGVFAHSLAECLALQLKDKNRLDPAMQCLLNNLDLMAKKEFAALRKICKVDEEDLRQMCKEIRSLNPKPGSDFTAEIAQTVQPDVFLRKHPNGNWVVELNSDVLPRMLVNKRYYALIKYKAQSDDDRKYMSEQLTSANWLVKCLHQRAETILKVATEIASQQEDFFDKGIHFLRPLVLRDIANALNIHESTVGRVTVNKYISTPRGLYEMKFFFSSSLGNLTGNEQYSSKTVKYLIKELIDKESAEEILSDEHLAKILTDKGIDVARRTVAKYREAMRIPSSSQRRREKKV